MAVILRQSVTSGQCTVAPLECSGVGDKKAERCIWRYGWSVTLRHRAVTSGRRTVTSFECSGQGWEEGKKAYLKLRASASVLPCTFELTAKHHLVFCPKTTEFGLDICVHDKTKACGSKYVKNSFLTKLEVMVFCLSTAAYYNYLLTAVNLQFLSCNHLKRTQK